MKENLNAGRTAIIFTANTDQIIDANLFFDSVRDEKRGNFKGDIWVISTSLSNRALNVLDSLGIKHHINPLQAIFNLSWWRDAAKNESAYTKMNDAKRELDSEEALRESFCSYRNKRMSKLILIDWVDKFGVDYDYVALCDNDLYFQRDINELLNKTHERHPDTIFYWNEENRINPHSNLWVKNLEYIRRYPAANLDFGENEINIGFITGKPVVMQKLMDEVRQKFFRLDSELFVDHGWHDQDLVRLIKAEHPERFAHFDEGDVIHMCNGGRDLIGEPFPLNFVHSKTNMPPYVVHFAGGAHQNYPSAKDCFAPRANDKYAWFDYAESKKAYKEVRSRSVIDIFDTVSDFFTASDIITRDNARKKWRSLRTNKPKVMFVGWLSTSNHNSFLGAVEALASYAHDYNFVCINGNSELKTYDGTAILEDMPAILSSLSRLRESEAIGLIRRFGVEMPGIDRGMIQDALDALIYEYACPEECALAIANLLHLYWDDCINYYMPDVLLGSVTYLPNGRIIRAICKKKGIPYASMEWGLYPGTVFFDFQGHMGGSWPAQKSDFFNELPIDGEDISKAEGFFRISREPIMSRNTQKQLDDVCRAQLETLKREGKIILFYIGSNNAHSGNIQSDPANMKVHSPHFSDDTAAFNEIVEYFKDNPEYHILFKPHPTEEARGKQYNMNGARNITVMKGGNIYDAIKLSDVAITLLSQSSYVSLLLEKPVVLLGNTQLNYSGAAYTINSASEAGAVIEKAAADGYTESQRKKFAEHGARILKYYSYALTEGAPSKSISGLADDILSFLSGKPVEHQSMNYAAYKSWLKPCVSTEITPIVSIIIPVYNSGEYLAECLISLMNQTVRDIEILCVNNGSTDDSLEIINYFAAFDSRIRLFEIAEPSQTKARNLGLREALGEYVMFMDSDDYIDESALEKLLDVSEANGADLVYYFYKVVRTQENYERPRFWSFSNYLPKERSFKLKREYYKFFIHYPFPWAKLIRRNFALENDLFFDEDCANFDDNPHNLRTLLSARNPYVLNETLYYFRIHGKSMTQHTNPRNAAMVDAVSIMNDIFREKNCYSEFMPYYAPYKAHILYFAWEMLPDKFKQSYFEKMKTLFEISELPLLTDDSVYSYFNLPSRNAVRFIKNAFEHDFIQFMLAETRKRICAEVSAIGKAKVKRVILFGAGKMGRKYAQTIPDNVTILAVADNDRKKHNNRLCGYRIISPESIADFEYDKVVVGMSSRIGNNVNDVTKQLAAFGIPAEKLEFPYALDKR